MPIHRQPAVISAVAAIAAGGLLLAGPVSGASTPPDVWSASGVVNAAGSGLAGHYGADRMLVNSCDPKGATRTCQLELIRQPTSAPEDYGSDCTWEVTVRRSKKKFKHSTKSTGCAEDESFPSAVHTSLRERRNRARAYRIAGAIAVKKAKAIFADETAVSGCDVHHSATRVCQVSVDHSGIGAACSYAVFVPPRHSRRHVRTLALGPCTASG